MYVWYKRAGESKKKLIKKITYFHIQVYIDLKMYQSIEKETTKQIQVILNEKKANKKRSNGRRRYKENLTSLRQI